MKNLKIQIDGTNRLNKGAELMLVAVLEQIEKNAPDAHVYYNATGNLGDMQNYPGLKVKQRLSLKYSRFPSAVLNRLHISNLHFTNKKAIKGMDVILDASGFQFSDQWDYSKERLDILENYYKKLKGQGAKIILLPQALGPFETASGKRMMDIVAKYVDILVAREKISYDYALKAGVPQDKLWLNTDFTLLVKATAPQKYEYLKNGVCIIPNKKMVTHTSAKSNEYLNLLKGSISFLLEKGEKPFLLNHEGVGDLALCDEVNSAFDNKLDLITDLNAKEVKGIIGQSLLTISSRFHGVASALNQGVPCLATSWNHKYEMLFKDFGLGDMILNIAGSQENTDLKISKALEERETIAKRLKENKKELSQSIEKMWVGIWKFIYADK